PTNTPNVLNSSFNAAAIAGMSLAAEQSSASYRFVAGANMQSANALALGAGSVGDVTIDGHTNFTIVPMNANAVVAVPTIVRTGTGSIDIAAGGNFQPLHHTAPGVVYTAGTISADPANNSSSVALGSGAWNGSAGPGVSTILTPQVNPDNAGNITLTVQGDIIGFQDVIDTLAVPGATPSGQSGRPGLFVGQFWLPWLLTNPADP